MAHAFQTDTTKQLVLNIKKATAPIQLDGDLSESDWQTADKAADFWRKFPDNKIKAINKTEAHVTYDDHFLYVGITCFDSGGTRIVQTLKRDVGFWESDGVSIVLDPQGRKANGFLFGVNASGSQTDMLLSLTNTNENWDNKWFSKTKQYIDRWVVEMAIPFKILRYESGRKTWKINFVRNDTRRGEYHTWTLVPLFVDGIDLGYTGTLQWDAPPPFEKSNVTLIPYVTGSTYKDFQNAQNSDNKPNAGLDAKMSVSTALNLDLTVNPDFSQIDVDEQVTNLTRFNIFYPERRTFFLENSDILSELGSPPLRPFFSRRIGLNENNRPVPIYYGARLSGNLTNKLRINALNMHTGGQTNGLTQNFSALGLQQSLDSGRSFTKLFLLNRQGFDGKSIQQDHYGRNIGSETYLVTRDNKWGGWLCYHTAFKPNVKTENKAWLAGFEYRDDNLQFLMDWNGVGKNYQTDMGIVPRLENYDAQNDTTIRLGFTHNYDELNYSYYPKNQRVNRYWFGFENYTVFNTDYSLNEQFNRLRTFIFFKNTSELRFRFDVSNVNLPFATDFLGEGVPLPPKNYKMASINIEYAADRRKKLSWNVSLTQGGFYDGSKTTFKGGINYRLQPLGNFGLDAQYNRLRFGAPYKSGELWLMSSKIELNFSQNLFWTTFFQYNTQSKNFNINSRIQWRFKPMSDVFLVYTDNYLPESFQKVNRALVFKVNYWLNL
jgi:Domain of unknown function (DUF5916)/Carbohydrate family 9 binding domain-like